MSISSIIAGHIAEVAADQGKTLAPINRDTVLLDCGLDSLCFAIIVARLEDELGVDPFASAEEFIFPETFGDLADFYERAVG